MELTTFWFIIIGVLWTGYFVLEGFDFGVGMLLPVLGKGKAEATGVTDPVTDHIGENERRRRVMLNTIGPVWDGNEVWVLTAGGATFAAFPNWYATLFSGAYLPLLLILVALIVRNMGFEYRHKRDSEAWRKGWDYCIIGGSLVAPLLVGAALTNLVYGLKMEEHMSGQTAYTEYTGSLFSLLNPVSLLGGITIVALCITHGAHFIALKTMGAMHDRARKTSARLGWTATVIALVWALMFNIMYVTDDGRQALTWAFCLLVVVLLAAGSAVVDKGREGLAFLCTGLGIALMIVACMVAMYGNLGYRPSGIPFDMWIAAATPMTLKIMTISACVFVPIVLAYQIWSYWVFRKRLTREAIPDTAVAA